MAGLRSTPAAEVLASYFFKGSPERGVLYATQEPGTVLFNDLRPFVIIAWVVHRERVPEKRGPTDVGERTFRSSFAVYDDGHSGYRFKGEALRQGSVVPIEGSTVEPDPFLTTARRMAGIYTCC
jgi:hypothetical protein